MLKYLQQIWNSKDLRKKILYTLFFIIIARLTTHISIPHVNLTALREVLGKNQILGVYSILTGGSAENFSIVLMGLSPYINASIILQLLTVIVPKLENLSKEGEQGRKKINQYTRWLTFPLAFLQSYGMIFLINSQASRPIIENINDPKVILPIMMTISAGTIFLMWLGEILTEKGISNGISLLIFVNIISNIPTVLGQTLALSESQSERLIPLIILILATVIFSIIVIIVTESYRKIPITYAGKNIVRGGESMLPIRINHAGMIPIIFAISVVSFPNIISQIFLQRADSEFLKNFGRSLNLIFQPQSFTYNLVYFLLIIAFTYFYVSITFNPQNVSESIQKRGGFIPGIRPGKQTAEYLGKVSNRLNFFGGTFIGFIAVSPLFIQKIFTQSNFNSVPLLISGAGLIIVVGVVLELIRQINSQLIMHDYDKLY